ncbi:tetratricopeptide repeat-containing glycosyltransferase family 2 protein [Gottfriedia luciferensis]|uniref:tetratricopeptide repeat-containing glycosyltransferase family 2 protein n=1 Tax=Gottfriedia luciferensis TaxID=178774 RepID=UPI001F3F7634|nr:glycosyltransferase [Gottfriedia luciferensis]
MKNNAITLSLCMIVKNEEAVLSRCLSSISNIVDEIIIVDTGSTDKTKEIAKNFNSLIYDFKWINDFSAARNFAFSKATKDYIIWLDADDILTEENANKLLALKKSLNKKVDAVGMKYHLSFDENGNPSFSSVRHRIVKRERNFKWIGFVHEYLEVYGEIIQSDAAIIHQKDKEYSDRNLKIYENAISSGKELSPRDKYYYANECVDNQLYEKAVEWYELFLKEGKGWYEDSIQACGKMADCFINLQNWEKAINSCLKSFYYDGPRGENCCRLGYIYLQQGDYSRAISWYKLATLVSVPETSPFINQACYTWLPHLQLCLCYSRLGDQVTAKKHNDLAANYVPNNPSVLYNQEYFRTYFKD